MPKKLKGGQFGIFKHPFCRKTPKNGREDPLGKMIETHPTCNGFSSEVFDINCSIESTMSTKGI